MIDEVHEAAPENFRAHPRKMRIETKGRSGSNPVLEYHFRAHPRKMRIETAKRKASGIIRGHFRAHPRKMRIETF